MHTRRHTGIATHLLNRIPTRRLLQVVRLKSRPRRITPRPEAPPRRTRSDVLAVNVVWLVCCVLGVAALTRSGRLYLPVLFVVVVVAAVTVAGIAGGLLGSYLSSIPIEFDIKVYPKGSRSMNSPANAHGESCTTEGRRRGGRLRAAVVGAVVALAMLNTGGCTDPAADHSDPAMAVMAAQPFVTAASAVLDIDGLESTRVGGCGATVITVNRLLTAAHCVLTPFPPLAHTDVPRPVAPAQVRARIGSADRTSGGTVRAITQIDVDPEFQYLDYAHDFAVLSFDQPLAASSVAALGDAVAGASIRTLAWTTAKREDGTYPPRAAVASYAPAVLVDHRRCPFLTGGAQALCFEADAGAGSFGSGGSGLFRVVDHAAIRLVGVISMSGNVEQTTGIANPVLPQSPWLRKFLPA